MALYFFIVSDKKYKIFHPYLWEMSFKNCWCKLVCSFWKTTLIFNTQKSTYTMSLSKFIGSDSLPLIILFCDEDMSWKAIYICPFGRFFNADHLLTNINNPFTVLSRNFTHSSKTSFPIEMTRINPHQNPQKIVFNFRKTLNNLRKTQKLSWRRKNRDREMNNLAWSLLVFPKVRLVYPTTITSEWLQETGPVHPISFIIIIVFIIQRLHSFVVLPKRPRTPRLAASVALPWLRAIDVRKARRLANSACVAIWDEGNGFEGLPV